MTDTTTATPDLVAQGVALYAKAEQAAHDLEEALLSLRKLYTQGYVNGDLSGGDAIKARSSMISLAGDVAAIHGDLISMHERDIGFAKAANADIAAPYAELPPKSGPVIESGSR